jgi:DNA modification methylase
MSATGESQSLSFLDGRVTQYVGDVRTVLKSLPADHFDCVLTSPPYWGLRNYDVIGQLGLEPTLGEHLAAMVDVFREVRRVLKPTGVCWINYGDCYATSVNGRSAADTKALGNDDRTFRDKPFSTIGPVYVSDQRDYDRRGNHSTLTGAAPPPSPGRIAAGGFLKAKDMCLVPERLWIALQDDGWWIRSKFPWIKRNGMPERAEDRPANSLEQMAMLTKSARYWYDAEIVRKAASASTNARVAQNTAALGGSQRANGGRKTNGPMKAVVRKPGCGPKSAGDQTNIKAKDSFHASTTEVLNDRNFRNTDLFFSSLEAPWGLISDADGTPLAIDANPKGFSEAHFATFPPALIEPLILAGCPLGGSILDPFEGSGTTGLVAAKLGRIATLIDLSPEYAVMARARIEAAFMSREEGKRHMVKRLNKTADAGPLFGGGDL